jgi:hypothetical protein
VGVDMPFSNYYKLPITKISKWDYSDGSYSFSATEESERMSRAIYDFKSALSVDILDATTTFSMRDSIADFPSSGFLKLDDEFVSYASKDLVLNRFEGVIRGELGSTPADHDANTDCVLVETVSGNPLDILLKILISGGGGGSYDVLQDGLGIDETLIDIAEIEELRDSLFVDQEIELSLYEIDSALRYIETELLMPFNLRFTYSISSKLTLAILDKAIFVEENDIINHDTITKAPKTTVDGSKVVNVIDIEWDYDEGTNRFNKRGPEGGGYYEDADSITQHGRQNALTFQFKGIKSDLDGQALVDDFAQRLLARLSQPTPEIEINTQVDKSLQTIGDKAYLVSNLIPTAQGDFNFASDLEIVSRSFNWSSGDVKFKLAYTSFTEIRSCFIAPSDLILTKTSQKILGLAAGRGDLYRVGWKMRLWDHDNQVFLSDPVNTIESIDGDTITFENNWTTPITVPGDYRLRFADYDDVADSQKRYCFVGINASNFDDGKQSYKVTY